METQTITEIHGTREWQAQDGATNYQIEITLDDGRTGNVTAKTPDRWKVGDTVIIKKEAVNKYGYQWSLDKPQPTANRIPPNTNFSNPAPRSGQNYNDRSDIIEASWAIHMAILYGGPKKDELGWSTRDLSELGLRMLNARDLLVKAAKEQNEAK